MKIAFFENDIYWTQIVRRAFERSGHEIVRINLESLTMAEVLAELDRIHPDFCYIQNIHLSGSSNPRSFEEIEMFFSYDRIPMAIWYLDNPEFQGSEPIHRWWGLGKKSKNHLYFVNDKSFLDFFSQRDLPAFHLPIAVDLHLFTHPRKNVIEEGLRFVGVPYIKPPDHRESVESIRLLHSDCYFIFIERILTSKLGLDSAAILKIVDQIAPFVDSFFSRYYTQSADFNSGLNGLFLELASVLDEPVITLLKREKKELTNLYSWCQMTCYLRELVPLGMQVNGSAGWESFFPHQKNAPRFLEFGELFSSYSSVCINFCFTKWSLPTATHDRIYEILATGGFPLTDYRDSLDDHFKKGELAIYHSIDEAKDLIQFYLKNESERNRVRTLGEARVFESHTYDQRLTILIQKCREVFSL